MNYQAVSTYNLKKVFLFLIFFLSFILLVPTVSACIFDSDCSEDKKCFWFFCRSCSDLGIICCGQQACCKNTNACACSGCAYYCYCCANHCGSEDCRRINPGSPIWCAASCGSAAVCDGKSPNTSWCEGNIFKKCDSNCNYISTTCSPSGCCDATCNAATGCGVSPNSGKCPPGDWQTDPDNPCRERRSISFCHPDYCSCRFAYFEYRNKPNCTSCSGSPYCVGNTRYYNFHCKDGSCVAQSSENCDSKDGCYSGYYRDYYCSNGSCTYDSFCTETCCDQYYNNSNAYCSGGTCNPPPPSCSNECLFSGQAEYRCSDNTVQKRTCGNYDGDPCLEWSSWQNVENCDNYDGWYDTGNTRWVTCANNECKECQEKEQIYRNYYCSTGSCNHTTGLTRWVSTGSTKNKSLSTSCGTPGSWETDPTNECKERRTTYHCNGAGSCVFYQYEYRNKPNCTSCNRAPECSGTNRCGSSAGDTRYYNPHCSNGSCVFQSSENCRCDATDSDGTNYTTQGTCTDYTGCSGGSCQSSSYTDYCLSSTVVREYYVSGSGDSATCSYTDYTCTNLGSGYTCSGGKCVPPPNQPPNAKISCQIIDCNGSGCQCNGNWVTYNGDGVIYRINNNSTDPDNNIVKSTWSIIGYQDPYFSCPPFSPVLCNMTLPRLPAGNYTIKLKVEDGGGLSSEVSHSIQVKQDIIADFQCSLNGQDWVPCQNLSLFTGQIVYVKDVSLPSQGATITFRTWKKGDGVNFQIFAQNTVIATTTLDIQNKVIRLEVSDSVGRTDLQDYSLNVTYPLPRWKEIPPIIWIRKFLAAASEFFDGILK